MGQFERQYDERIHDLTFQDLADSVRSDAEASPDIILDTLSLALSSIDNKVNLVVSTPSRESFGRVLAALLAIDFQLKEDEALRFTTLQIRIFPKAISSRWEMRLSNMSE